jgi:Kef-type K+ transport system membrane component KefB/nucleotide-binding universal stress UspA family protein
MRAVPVRAPRLLPRVTAGMLELRGGRTPGKFLVVAGAGIVALLASQPAWAASAAFNPSTEPVFIAEILVLLVSGRLLGEVMQRLGQPPVMGQLLAGILLGPSLFGALFPHLREIIFPASVEQKSMLQAVSQLGILMLLLLTGMETDLALVRKVRTPALLIALSGIAVPFACGFALGEFLPASLLPDPGKRLLTALFLGTALSISSIKIVAMVVRDMNFMRRNLGQIIVASAIIEDTAGWIIISITLGIASRGSVDALSLAKTVFGIALFLAASFTIGRPLVFRIIRLVNDTFQSEFAVITTILVIMGAMALITAALGVQTVLGAFVAGVLIGESPILTRHIDAQLRGLIVALFMPVFFGLAGLSADLRILGNLQLFLLTAGLILIASVGKFSGAWLGAKMGGLSAREGTALGCAMNARGSTEIIVASIGLASGALSRNLFTMVVTMAVLTTTAMPPMLRKALSGLPMSREERARLEREDVDARGFVSSLERLLLAVDASPVGKLAARLAGLIAGARGMPLTIVELKSSKAPRSGASDSRDEATTSKQAVESGVAASAASLKAEKHADAPKKVDISEHAESDGSKVVEIADKGFDLLFVGVEGSQTPDGHFSPKVTQIVEGYRATLALLVTNESCEPPDSGARILVPITGTAVSRRGAEVAFVLARALNASVTALYVSRATTARRAGRLRRLSLTQRNEEAVLRDIVRLAARYGVEVRTAIENDSSPDAQIRRYAVKHDLIVMGVNRRPGDVLFLGNTALALAAHRECPILFIADAEQRPTSAS